MEYEGMPLSWSEYSPIAYRHVSDSFHLSLSEPEIAHSSEILADYNPRVTGREIEYAPEMLFDAATRHWRVSLPMQELIVSFWKGVKLRPRIYSDTVPVLKELKKQGFFIAALTDLPSAMPDKMFCQGISSILDQLDLYVSSQSCGYRKPNPTGLFQIARHFNCNMDALVYIGDEVKDAAAAQNAGCRFIRICRDKEGDLRSSLDSSFSLLQKRG